MVESTGGYDWETVDVGYGWQAGQSKLVFCALEWNGRGEGGTRGDLEEGELTEGEKLRIGYQSRKKYVNPNKKKKKKGGPAKTAWAGRDNQSLLPIGLPVYAVAAVAGAVHTAHSTAPVSFHSIAHCSCPLLGTSHTVLRSVFATQAPPRGFDSCSRWAAFLVIASHTRKTDSHL